MSKNPQVTAASLGSDTSLNPLVRILERINASMAIPKNFNANSILSRGDPEITVNNYLRVNQETIVKSIKL
jgi:hypothetical protein